MSMEESARREAIEDAWLGFIRSRFEPAIQSKGSGNLAPAKLAELELQTMSDCFARAKQYRNAAVSGACRLPTEILSFIFMLAQEDWDPEREMIPVGPSQSTEDPVLWKFSRGWMALTEVCHIWRCISLGCSALWTRVLCSAVTPLHLPIILARSHQLPLELRVETPVIEPGDHATSLFRDLRMWLSPMLLRRAERLSVGAEDGITLFCIQAIVSLFETDAPVLKDLHISINGDRVAYLSDTCCAPSNPPPIQRLSLRNCLVWTSSPLLSINLTYLSLRATGWEGGAAYSTDLRPVLAAMDRLQELHLVDVSPCRIEHGPYALRLPTCFRMLDIELIQRGPFTTDGIIPFLSGLILPTLACVYCKLEDYYEEEALLEMVSGLISGLDWSETRIEVYMTDYTIAIRPFLEYNPDNRLVNTEIARHWDDPTVVAAALSHHRTIRCSSFEDYSCPVACLQEIFSRHKAYSLHLNGDVLEHFMLDVNVDGDRGPLSSLSDVRRITIESLFQEQAEFFTALSKRHFRGTTPQPIFPRLQTLVLFNSGISSYDTSAQTRRAIAYAEAELLNCLESRAALGFPVENILVDRAYSKWDIWSLIVGETKVSFIGTIDSPPG